MKTKISILLATFIVAFGSLMSQDVTTVTATNNDISENLDLEAVASIFGEAENLEDFEEKLNDPKNQISNLDLNGDGEVDYLRVIENSKDGTHVVTIQAVLGKDQYQDVATIDVEKDSNGETQVQVVGDVYMYGPDYIITPVYVRPPVIFVWFWGPLYRPWRSPFYWGYYPPYFHPWHPYPSHVYRRNVHVHVNVNNTYDFTSVRRSKSAVELQNKSRRNDYGTKHPDRSFAKRNEGVKNKQGLNKKRTGVNESKTKSNEVKRSTGKPVQKDWKPASEKGGSKSKVKDNKVSTPAKKQNNKTTAKPASRQTPKAAKKPSAKPRAKTKRR